MREDPRLDLSDSNAVGGEPAGGSRGELATAGLRRPAQASTFRLLLYGTLSFCLGIAMYLFGVLLVFPRYLLGLNALA